MAKKKKTRDVQISIRLERELAERLERTARSLATSVGPLIRMMVAEHLPTYEKRAKIARGELEGDAEA